MVQHTTTKITNEAATLPVGVPVQVRTRFDGGWTSGFAVAEVVSESAGSPSYRLTRASDGCVLPALFPAADVLPLVPQAAGNTGSRR